MKELTGIEHLPSTASRPTCSQCRVEVSDGIAYSPGVGCSRCVPNILDIMTVIATAENEGGDP